MGQMMSTTDVAECLGLHAPDVQALLNIVGPREFRARVEALGGYDTAESGRILSPDFPAGRDLG